MGSEKPTKVLVTGAAGFIGARLVESLHQQGVPVISVDRQEYFDQRHGEQGVSTRIPRSTFGEIVDRDQLFDTSAWPSEVSHIVHLGACTDTTELDVDYLTRTNLRYSQELWNRCAESGIALVYASSAATYGAGEHGYEDDEGRIEQLRPLNPYGDSKLQFDLWVLDQEQQGWTPPSWCGFKFFNVYGYGERHKNKMASVVLHAFDQIRATGSVRLFRSHRDGIGHGHQSRDFVWVDDVVRVLQFAMEKPLGRGIFNLGCGRARTFLDLARAVFGAVGGAEAIDFIDTPEALRERYQYFTEATLGKLRAAGFEQPFTSLEEGVARTVSRISADGVHR